MKDRDTAIVIGSGFGGLAAAIRLAAKGVPTTILESRDKPGGRAYRLEEKGFSFDCGPTVITAPKAIEELFTLANRSMKDYVTLHEVNPYYRLYWEGGETFDFNGDKTAMKEQIARFEPRDAQGYEDFLRYAESVYKVGYGDLVSQPFLKIWDLIKVSPDLIRLSGYRSVYGQVAKFFRHDKIRQAFSFNSLLIGGNPFKASAIYTLIHPLERAEGVHFPEGGTFALVQGLCQLFKDLGGKIELNQKVTRIDYSQGEIKGVQTENSYFPAHAVISNADVVSTYEKFLKPLSHAKAKTKSLKAKNFSMSLFVLYLGLNRSFDQLAHHNIFFSNRYKELLNDIFVKGIITDDFSIYLHNPPNSLGPFAPQGGQAMYALIPVPHLGKSDFNWEKNAPTFAESVLTRLEHFVPGLKAAVTLKRWFSPQDFSEVLGSHLGSAFSLEPTLTQSAYFRVKNADAKLRGLYFVGAGTHPGAGIPGVIHSAKATTDLYFQNRGL